MQRQTGWTERQADKPTDRTKISSHAGGNDDSRRDTSRVYMLHAVCTYAWNSPEQNENRAAYVVQLAAGYSTL